MKPDGVYIVGLRLKPDETEPELFTLWFEDERGKNRVARVEGRIQWALTLDEAKHLTDSECDLSGSIDAELDSVCNIAHLLYGLQHPGEVDEMVALLALNLLDDLVLSIDYPLPRKMQKMLDRIAVGLTEDKSLSETLGDSTPSDAIEAVLASLGRVLCFSDFKRSDPASMGS